MPVILPDDAYDLWLDPVFQKPDAICDLRSLYSERMTARHRVKISISLIQSATPFVPQSS